MLFLMLYFLGQAQTNLINILFFTLNVVNAMILIKDDNKPSTLYSALLVSKLLMYLSMVVIVIEFAFAISFGQRESLFENSLEMLGWLAPRAWRC